MLVFGGVLLVSPDEAHAAPTCVKRDKFGRCTLTIDLGGKGGGSNSNDGGNSGGGKSSQANDGGGPAKCSLGSGSDPKVVGKEIPCSSDTGNWYSSSNCYITPAAGEVSDVVSAASGFALFTCTPANGGVPTEIVLPINAAGGPPPPDPAVLARQAIASMNLRAIKIGIVPESGPNSVGIIGLPTWLWVADPGPSTVGPITRSVSAGGFTVTATAQMKSISWKLGDGISVKCGLGTPYSDGYGKRSSPTCGHTYTRQGRYTVSATSNWVVEWAGIGEAGTIPLDFTESAQINMGESQVIVR